jgi:type I restriction enzyme S subunit
MTVRIYPQSQESGLPWVGRVPSQWEIAPLFSVVREREESNAGMVEDNLLSLSYGRIVRKDMLSNDGLLPESFETYQVVHPGDIVFRLTDLQNDKRSLRTALVGERGIITAAYLAVRPERASPSYLNYLLRAYDLSKVFYSMGGGLRQSMRFSDLKRLPVLLPSPSEQTAIVTFLDRETGKIDALVEDQKRLIELLKEKRQAVISRAVTKGLNPNVPMKASGIDWLGEVPERWEIGPLKRFVSFLDGKRVPLSSEERSYRGGEVPYYGASGIIDWIDDFIFEEDLVLVSEDGANLINRATPIAFIATGRYWVNNHAHILRPKDGDLIYWSERVEAVDLVPFVTGSAQPKLTIDALANIQISVPATVEEREAISNFIIATKAAIDPLIEEVRTGIAFLEERRSALISAAVTGKIDVRTATVKMVAA